MSRADLPQAIIGRQTLHGVLLVDIDHQDGVFRVHSGTGQVIVDGNTYEGVGVLLEVNGITDGDDNASTWEMTLSRANEMLTSYTLDGSLRDRGIRLAVSVSEDGLTWSASTTIKVGRISALAVSEGGISAECATAFLDTQRVRQAHILWTDAQHKEFVNENDVTFRNVRAVRDVAFVWP